MQPTKEWYKHRGYTQYQHQDTQHTCKDAETPCTLPACVAQLVCVVDELIELLGIIPQAEGVGGVVAQRLEVDALSHCRQVTKDIAQDLLLLGVEAAHILDDFKLVLRPREERLGLDLNQTNVVPHRPVDHLRCHGRALYHLEWPHDLCRCCHTCVRGWQIFWHNCPQLLAPANRPPIEPIHHTRGKPQHQHTHKEYAWEKCLQPLLKHLPRRLFIFRKRPLREAYCQRHASIWREVAHRGSYSVDARRRDGAGGATPLPTNVTLRRRPADGSKLGAQLEPGASITNRYSPRCANHIPVELIFLCVTIVPRHIALGIGNDVCFATRDVRIFVANAQGVARPTIFIILTMLILHRAKRKARVVALVPRNELWCEAMVLLGWKVRCNGELGLEGGAFLAVAPELHINRIFGNGEIIFTTAR